MIENGNAIGLSHSGMYCVCQSPVKICTTARIRKATKTVNGAANATHGTICRLGYFRIISRETLSNPTRKMDTCRKIGQNAIKATQNSWLENSTPSLFAENADSATGIIIRHTQKSHTVFIM